MIVGILKYVNKTIRYQTDKFNFGWVENWEDLTESIKRKKADCENQNAIVKIIATIAGIPSFLVWCCIGVSNEGHYWLIYFSSKRANFYSIDSTFKPNKSFLEYRQPFKIAAEYKQLHYLFNENSVFKTK